MAEKDQENPVEEAEETVRADAAEEKKPEAKPKTKAKTKTKSKAKTKTAAAEKPAEKPPVAAPPPPAEPPFVEQTPPGGGAGRMFPLGGAVAVVGAVVVLVLAVMLFGSLGGGGKNIIIGFPDNDWNLDIYLLRPGEDEDDGVRIAKDIEYAGSTFYIYQDGNLIKTVNGFGFVPDSSQVFLSYYDDGETILEQMQVKDDETSDLFDTDDWVTTYVSIEQERMLLIERQDDGVRCHVAEFGEEADRLDSGIDCFPSLDGRYVVIVDEDDNETTFTLFDLNKDDEEEILTEEDIADYAFSYDLRMLAYVVNSSSDEQELHLFNIADEEDEDIEEDYAIPDLGFTRKGDLYYVVEDDDGNMEAFVYGNNDAIAEGEIMSVQAGPEGDFLIIISGDDEDDLAVYAYSVRSEEAEEIMDGEYLEVAISEEPALVFISEFVDGDLTLYVSDLDGSDLVEIYDESDVYYFDIVGVTGQDFFLITISGEDGDTLFGYRAGGDEAFALLEEWYSIDPLNVSSNGRYLVVAAAEDSGDDEILLSIEVNEDADMVELDDDIELAFNAVFTTNDRDVIYTATTGDDPDDVSIYQVPVSGDDKPEELHEEAFLLDAQWANINPFTPLSFSWLLYGGGF
jgi:hypothetical protein